MADSVEYNRRKWDELAAAGDRYYRAVTPEEVAEARKGNWKIQVTPQKPVPRDWFGDWVSGPLWSASLIAGNKQAKQEPARQPRILCLAAGGGRQGPILAAAGADVTVFDLSEKQLDRDREIAQRDNLQLELVAGDMSDLSCFENESFDLIVNPCSTCFVPDVQPVWRECYRVLRVGGHLITGFINPVYYLFDAKAMDAGRLEARHSIPYSDFDLPEDEREKLLGDQRPREFGHSLEDLIGFQLQAGFALTGFFEDGWGQNDKLSSMIGVFCGTRATKTIL